MKAIIKHKKRIKDLRVGLEEGQQVEVEEIGFDENYKEKIYRIIGYTLWLPKSDLKFI